MEPAPIALFVYNRPWHTRQTVEALQKNELAEDSELFIFSDAPKNEEDSEKTARVREFIRSVEGFKSVTIIEREDNHGLAGSIIAGVTEIIERYDKIIVLEDDLLSSPYFLRYMNDGLAIYENEAGVMHIAGYMYPMDSSNLPETFFYRAASCWGWGTWKRAWRLFEADIEKLVPRFDKAKIKSFNIDGCYDFWWQVEALKRGEIDSWAIRWYASVFLNNGLCLHPARSLIDNIGLDGTGMHCGSTDTYRTSLRDQPIKEFERTIAEHTEALHRIKRFLASTRVPFWKRAVRKIRNLAEF